MITLRMERINREVQRAMNEIVKFELKDPRLQDVMLSVQKVEVTKDMKNCKAFVSVMPFEKGKETIKLLNSCESYIKRILTQKVDLRNAPEIRFVLDTTEEYSARIEDLIKEIHKNDKE